MAWKWADWNRFIEFRASIYIVLVSDLLYNTLTEGCHLWTYESPTFHLSHNILNIIVAFGSFPFAIMLFLSLYPEKGFFIQVLYNLTWSSVFSTHEWMVTWFGLFDHHCGWSLWWSFMLNLVAFPFIRLHQQKPLWAIPIFFLCASILFVIFQLPIIFD
jgi:hypothetical protein